MSDAPAASRDMFAGIVALLDRAGARYRVIEHAAEGRSEQVAAIRGTTVGQGAKALVCDVIGGAPSASQVLAVLSGADKADLKAIGRHFGGRKAQFSTTEAVLAATGCVTGTVPPFTLDGGLPLVADAGFLGRMPRSPSMPAGSTARSSWRRRITSVCSNPSRSTSPSAPIS